MAKLINLHFKTRMEGGRTLDLVASTLENFDFEGFDFDAGMGDFADFKCNFSDGDCTTSSERDSPTLDFEIDNDWLHPHHLPVPVGAPGYDGFDEGPQRKRKERKRTDLWSLGAPKVMKNDIRRSFAKMFLNTINGGDFSLVQDFSSTFISPTSQFVANLKFNGDFGFPAALVGVGPRALVHHLLGCFVMFPDMVGTMGDTQIVTSNSWTGTKIIIPWDCKFTIAHRIPAECWIPPADKAEQMYTEPSIERMLAALNVADTPAAPSCGSTSTAGCIGELCTTGESPTQAKRKRDSVPRVNSSLVPASYAEALLAGAIAVPYTPTLSAQGSYTIMLDENNHVQSIYLDFHEGTAAK